MTETMEMMEYPFLAVRSGRGAASGEAPPLSWMQIGVKGEGLALSGMTPLMDDGEHLI